MEAVVVRAVGVERQRFQEIVHREGKERVEVGTWGVRDRERIERGGIVRAQLVERVRLPALARDSWWREKLGIAQQRKREMLQSRERVERARVEARGTGDKEWRIPPHRTHGK